MLWVLSVISIVALIISIVALLAILKISDKIAYIESIMANDFAYIDNIISHDFKSKKPSDEVGLMDGYKKLRDEAERHLAFIEMSRKNQHVGFQTTKEIDTDDLIPVN
jgi:hypothetical protein